MIDAKSTLLTVADGVATLVSAVSRVIAHLIVVAVEPSERRMVDRRAHNELHGESEVRALYEKVKAQSPVPIDDLDKRLRAEIEKTNPDVPCRPILTSYLKAANDLYALEMETLQPPTYTDDIERARYYDYSEITRNPSRI